ncbi:hypothetical protein [Massilia sp. Se16.2.3]|nr:hypothetical protein [Massilia sp. Se16.2.3]QNA99523.1 hypothetical protein G4G31_12915 [Massilia sp. Se16.2.3]
MTARLGLVKQMVEQNRAGEAPAELDRIARAMPANATAALRGSLEEVRGDVFNARGQHEKALGAFLRALRLVPDEPGAGERRAYLGSRIAQVYINIDNAAKGSTPPAAR